MRLSARIARLERHPSSTCVACVEMIIPRVWNAETGETPEPARCEACGRDVTLYIKLLYDDVASGTRPRIPLRG